MTHTVASVLIDTLIADGIDQLYCLPGVQNDDFFDVLFDRQASLSPIQTRHEQGAAYMALGAALATGRPQAFAIVPGPGFLNASTALATAYSLNAPVLAIIGQIPLGAIGKGFGLLHEIPDQLGILRTLTKHAERITCGEHAADIIERAFTLLRSGRPRPVGIEVPVDVWNSPLAAATPPAAAPERAEIPAHAIDDAARILDAARRPLIVVGGGAQASSAAITRLAEMLSAPVLAFRNGHGVLAGDHPLCVGGPVGHELWRTVDVVLALGTRLQTQQMQWGVDDDMQIIHIDVDAAELGRINPPAVGIEGDLVDVLPLLLGTLGDRKGDREDWLQTVADTKARFAEIYAQRLAPQLAWLQAIRTALPRDGVFVDELTQVGYVSRFAFPVYQPRTFLSTGYQGTLGWGLATALGAAHARRDVPVVSVAGDGGALFTISELATAAHHQIPLVSVIFNDNAFGNVRRFQIEKYDNRPIASDLTSPDFVKLADSFGVRGLRATAPEQLRSRLEEAFRAAEPTVIEVPVGDFPSPWEFILMPRVRGN